jgi:hypothetical protein
MDGHGRAPKGLVAPQFRTTRAGVLQAEFDAMRCVGSGLLSGRIAGWPILVGLALALTLVVSGCAGVSVGLQENGTYKLESSEATLDCDKLYKNIWGRIQLVKGMPERARKELQQTPSTAFLAMGRIFGGQNKGLATIDEYDREIAHIGALHQVMLEKRCPSLNLERELADTESAMSELRRN